jgi:hypothetical protein
MEAMEIPENLYWKFVFGPEMKHATKRALAEKD